MDFFKVELESVINEKRFARILRGVQAAFEAEDYARTVSRSRDLLQLESDAVEGLIYLARAAAFTGDWVDVATAGEALVLKSPKDALTAAAKLNRAGRSLEAARIYANLDINKDWFDAEAADIIRKDGALLIAAGEAASERSDNDAATMIWGAGARIAPRSQVLAGKVRRLTRGLKTTLAGLHPDQNLEDYLKVSRLLAWLNPGNLAAVVGFARASERSSPKDAIYAWVRVLAVDPGHSAANSRLRLLATRHGLEDEAIAELTALGRDEASDPLVHELIAARRARVNASRDKEVRLAAQAASLLERETDPTAYLAAWLGVMTLSPDNVRAVRKVISCAGHLHDYPALVDGWIAQLEITPADVAGAERLIAAATRSGQELRALDCLLRHGLTAHLPKAKLDLLARRVIAAGKAAVLDSDFDLALACYDALNRFGEKSSGVDRLRLALANGLVTWAKTTDDQSTAVALAEVALEIIPDHPIALTFVARDLWAEKRFSELMAFCSPRVKDDPQYDAVNKMIEEAAFAA